MFTVIAEKLTSPGKCMWNTDQRPENKSTWNSYLVNYISKSMIFSIIFYSVKNWNTPMIFDLKNGNISLIVLAEK